MPKIDQETKDEWKSTLAEPRWQNRSESIAFARLTLCLDAVDELEAELAKAEEKAKASAASAWASNNIANDLNRLYTTAKRRAELAELQVAFLSKHIVDSEKDQYGNPDPDNGKSWVDAILEDTHLSSKSQGGE